MVSVDEAKAWVQRRLTPERYDHSHRVAELAASLADRFSVDPEKAFMAGILHDAARELSASELLLRAKEYGLAIDPVEEKVPLLLHGLVGAELVRTELGMDEPQILDAIRYHTTGRVGMSCLEKLIFVADYAEPGRPFPAAAKVRSVLNEDLDTALRIALDESLIYLLSVGYLLHPSTVAARNAMYL